jgi:hypothetical protein
MMLCVRKLDVATRLFDTASIDILDFDIPLLELQGSTNFRPIYLRDVRTMPVGKEMLFASGLGEDRELDILSDPVTGW